MGRHKQIESILLQELTLGEERSQRALIIIEHQERKIKNLEKELESQHQKITDELNKTHKIVGLEEYERIQSEISELYEGLMQIKDMQKQISNEDFLNNNNNHDKQQRNGESSNSSGTFANASQMPLLPLECDSNNESHNLVKRETSVNILFQEKVTQTDNQTFNDQIQTRELFKEFEDLKSRLEPDFQKLKQDVDMFKENCETCSENEAILKRKVESMRHKVKWLKQERDEVVTFLKEISEWRKQVEGVLLDLSSGINERSTPPIKVDKDLASRKRQIWKTARKFFTTDEAHFFLSS